MWICGASVWKCLSVVSGARLGERGGCGRDRSVGCCQGLDWKPLPGHCGRMTRNASLGAWRHRPQYRKQGTLLSMKSARPTGQAGRTRAEPRRRLVGGSPVRSCGSGEGRGAGERTPLARPLAGIVREGFRPNSAHSEVFRTGRRPLLGWPVGILNRPAR